MPQREHAAWGPRRSAGAIGDRRRRRGACAGWRGRLWNSAVSGWDDTTWLRWAERVDDIYHCAAATCFDLPLEQAQRINVGGLLQVHAFAVVAAALGDLSPACITSARPMPPGRTKRDVRAAARRCRPTKSAISGIRTGAHQGASRALLTRVCRRCLELSIASLTHRSATAGAVALRSWNVCYAPIGVSQAIRISEGSAIPGILSIRASPLPDGLER